MSPEFRTWLVRWLHGFVVQTALGIVAASTAILLLTYGFGVDPHAGWLKPLAWVVGFVVALRVAGWNDRQDKIEAERKHQPN